MDTKEQPWQTLESKEIYNNPWITVNQDRVINPNGGQNNYTTVSFKNYALGIIPLDEAQNTWLVGQHRYPLDLYSWEIPMGGGLKDRDILESAKRELMEETGLVAAKWENIMKIHTSNSVTDEEGYVYLATDLTEGGETQFDETEALAIRKLPFTEALDMVMNQQITDSLSVAGILKTARLLKL